MEAFGIFEGGGAKGLAHIGALYAATEIQKLDFVGYAGTSAGAIIAALAAVGYTPNELYNPKSSERGIFTYDFQEFLDNTIWNNLQSLKEEAKTTFGNLDAGNFGLKKVWNIWRFYQNHRALLSPLLQNRGFFQTEAFALWLDDLLGKKLKKTSGFGKYKVLFSDIPKPLKIVTCDVSSRQVEVFSALRYPNVSVAEAVAASASIPFFFVPTVIAGHEMVDGGIVSNFPAWVFDEERKQHRGDVPVTVGFTLREKHRQAASPSNKLYEFIGGLLGTVASGQKVLGNRQIENLYIAELGVSFGTLDFDLSLEQKDRLYEEGRVSAGDFFLAHRRFLQVPKIEIVKATLGMAHGQMLNVLRTLRSAFGSDTHLRVSVVMPISEDILKVTHTYNMDGWEDTDDQLEMSVNVNGAGQCWQTQHFTRVDMAQRIASRDDGNLDKYQLALIRRDLKSLLCVPIFAPNQQDSLLGVLCFDSSEILFQEFDSNEIERLSLVAQEAATVVANLLYRE